MEPLSTAPTEGMNAGLPPAGGPARTHGYGAWVAWAAILLVAGLSIFADRLFADSEQGEELDDTVGLILVHLQGKYLIGASALMPMNAAQLYTQSEVMLNLGTLVGRKIPLRRYLSGRIGYFSRRIKFKQSKKDLRISIHQ